MEPGFCYSPELPSILSTEGLGAIFSGAWSSPDMCGIAGFWQKKRGIEHPIEVLKEMGTALAHRGPDDSGFCYDNSTGVGLAFRRLSILDLSAAGHQPMDSASGRYTIIFNGEVYNFEEIRKELGPGRNWRGHSDTEVMLEAIERWGIEPAVQRFVGMFAFALWDRGGQKLFLGRDRLGIKPVYYGFADGDFVFASELKAICEYPKFERRLDRGSLALYMRYAYVPSPHCIYQGLYKLPPGHILALSSPQEQPVLSRFWSGSEVARAGLDSRVKGTDAEVVAQLEEKLTQAVGLRMIADVPLGAFLSGGVDSSTVVALMQAQSSRPVKTFTIGFHEDDYNEAAHAKRVAAHLGTDHTELYVTPREAMDVIPLLSKMYDEPFADPSQIPTYLVSKLARDHVTVSLSGDGGDELFGGYARYFRTSTIWNSMKWAPKPVRKMAARLIHSVPPAGIDRIYKWVKPVIAPGKQLSAVGDKAHKLAGFMDAQDPQTIYMQALSYWTPSDVVRDSQEPETVKHSIEGSAWLPNIEERMMLTDLVNYLPDDILTKVDRASMAVSLEARVPVIDHRVVEFAWRLPLHFKIRNGTSKWALRQVLYKYVPPQLIERPKMGFGVPIDSWLRGPLREWAEDLLCSETLSRHGLFKVQPIREKWEQHLSGARNWQYLLWDVLMFQDWFQRGVRSTSSVAS
ncbi:MAG TPA: asparagine synthase (glutamine-hydrolyzing) [Candidatus Angelobacter sp.]|nr:asparagine synthase (glutamine-hydrolyzing) [Candidatus Angelobacter sp.]